MKRKKDLALLTALACTVITSVTSPGAYASDSVVTGAHHLVPHSHTTPARYKAALPQRAKCRRNGVVWSGGTASRFADRISPRPVRSRWDRKADSSVGCTGVDAFKRYRVSEQPWIR
jgi:hypothetical protein